MTTDKNLPSVDKQVLSNLIERGGHNNRDLFRPFILKYLNPSMREIIWKGCLFDTFKYQEINSFMSSTQQYKVSSDDKIIT